MTEEELTAIEQRQNDARTDDEVWMLFGDIPA